MVMVACLFWLCLESLVRCKLFCNWSLSFVFRFPLFILFEWELQEDKKRYFWLLLLLLRWWVAMKSSQGITQHFKTAQIFTHSHNRMWEVTLDHGKSLMLNLGWVRFFVYMDWIVEKMCKNSLFYGFSKAYWWDGKRCWVYGWYIGQNLMMRIQQRPRPSIFLDVEKVLPPNGLPSAYTVL